MSCKKMRTNMNKNHDGELIMQLKCVIPVIVNQQLTINTFIINIGYQIEHVDNVVVSRHLQAFTGVLICSCSD